MKKIILLVVAALMYVVTPIDAMAQRRNKSTDTNLVGHVIDARTREHIAYATIAVRGTTLGVATDAGGHYMLVDVPAYTELTVVASTVGYDPVEKVVTLKEGKTLELNFELRESSVEMEQVVVSANRQESNRKEAPTIVNIVASELFDRTSSANIAPFIAPKLPNASAVNKILSRDSYDIITSGQCTMGALTKVSVRSPSESVSPSLTTCARMSASKSKNCLIIAKILALQTILQSGYLRTKSSMVAAWSGSIW